MINKIASILSRSAVKLTIVSAFAFSAVYLYVSKNSDNGRKIASVEKLVLPQQELQKSFKKNKATGKVVMSSPRSELNKNEAEKNQMHSEAGSSYDPPYSSFESSKADLLDTFAQDVDQLMSQSDVTIPLKKTDEDSTNPTYKYWIPFVNKELPLPETQKNAVGSKTVKGASADDTRPAIMGKVIPLLDVASFSSTSIVSNVFAADALSCSSPTVQLFDLQTMSPLADNPISADPITGDVVFEFNPDELQLELDRPTRYLLRTTGCNVVFKRLVTSFYSPQDINYLSSFISEILKSDTSIPIEEIRPEDIEYLEKVIGKEIAPNETDLEAILDHIVSSPLLNDTFEETTGSSVSIVADSAPQIQLLEVPSSLAEGVSADFRVVATHWNSHYPLAYQWNYNGTPVSSSSLWQFTADPNSLVDAKIELWVGSKAIVGVTVDQAKPFFYFRWDYSIIDSYPVQLPIITLTSNQVTSSHDAIFSLNTLSQVNADGTLACDTLSSIAIVEDGSPVGDDDFIYSCEDTTINYVIKKLIDGDVDIDFYAKDINGLIGNKSSFRIHLDTTSPIISFTNLNSYYRADRTHRFEWLLTEANSSDEQEFSLSFSPDGVSWTDLSPVNLTNGPHTNSLFYSDIYLPNILSSVAKLKISYADLLGNPTSVIQAIDIRSPILERSPISYDFANILNLSTSIGQSFFFRNSGNADAEDCSVSLIGDDSSDFTIDSNSCTGNLASIGTCVVSVKSSPLTKGSKSASLKLTCGSDSIQSSLSATSTNNPPITGANKALTIRDNLTTIVELNPGSDIDNPIGDLRYKITSAPAVGSLTNCLTTASYSTDLTCDFIAPENFHGDVSFSYIVNDGTHDSVNETTVTLTVQDKTSTQPNLIPFNFSAGNLTDSNPLLLTAASCSDIALGKFFKSLNLIF